MSIVITKRISLEFLGDDYKEGYLVLKSIPVKEFKVLQTQIAKYQDDNEKALDYIIDLVSERLVEGKIPQGETTVDITKENIVDMPSELFLQAISQLTGQISPN